MIDKYDASHDELRLVVAKAMRSCEETVLRRYLRNSDPILRTASARELHTRGGLENFKDALALVHDVRYDMREIGAFVLGQLGTPVCPFASQSFQPLSELLDDPYFEVKIAASGALGFLASLGHPFPAVILKKLLALLEDPEPLVRANTALALAVVPDTVVESYLEKIGEDNDQIVREAAEFAIEMHRERKGNSQ